MSLPLPYAGLKDGLPSRWRHAGFAQAGFAVVPLETRHAKVALPLCPSKRITKDARGIAQRVRMGSYRPVHCKRLAV